MINFNQPADIVAPQLLGAVLRHGPVAVQLTEVEAYLGEADPASHAYKGLTPRCATMFGPPSHLYVYASYGIHRAGNLVCSPDGTAGGVLLRGARVLAGMDVVRERRGAKPVDEALARGPGNLGSAMGFDLNLNGLEVVQVEEPFDLDEPVSDNALYLHEGDNVPEFRVGPRIGITKNADAPLRFWIPGDKTVTTPRR
ncbi:DNA-3-methyladenine glycosylase [Corynebacterium suicordis]|uniref:DNA-3-methyladenine glycosylase n=1 Tax=uncultured Corynebacterium sp. TaxID=159447 RepID=UPI00259751CC|nr:DNA-3-methyladenine glycosylase [uncultured Corynebacterium sp.]